MVHDFSHHTVQLQPIARELYEHMSRREWTAAERAAQALADLAFELKQHALRQQIRSGIGYIYEA